jgi:hypothetical protein
MQGTVKQASFLDALKMVFWGALGIRRKTAHEEARVKPLHLVVLVVMFVVLFITTLRFIVSVVVG